MLRCFTSLPWFQVGFFLLYTIGIGLTLDGLSSLENQLSILFAYATAYQARETKNLYTSDNVHCLFKIPIDGSQGKVNLELMKFDIVIIDEVGMVTKVNMRHVISSLKSPWKRVSEYAFKTF